MPKGSIIGGCVYIMSDEKGLVKIGSTNNLKRRISSIRCGNPTAKIDFQTETLKNRVEVEKLAQSSVAHFNVGGEWFDCSLSVAKLAVELSVNDVGDIMAGGTEIDHDDFESRLESANWQVVGILSKLNFEKHPEIVNVYTDYLYETNKSYLPVYAKKTDSEKFLEAATVLANTYVANK